MESELARLGTNSNWRPQVLTIAVIAEGTDFKRVLDLAAPIVESLEFSPD